VYSDNTTGSYNALYAAAISGIKRVCLASSINAIGGVYSRNPRYDYFPVDEEHQSYAEDPYSMSKWALELQGDAFARRYEDMSITSLRFHWLVDTREVAMQYADSFRAGTIRHLWAYTLFSAASEACLLSLTADFTGHEALYIVAPRTAVSTLSVDLANTYYPDTPIRGDLSENCGFFDSSKAERILGWKHED
jgi:UDP-glucose 4-epimerase